MVDRIADMRNALDAIKKNVPASDLTISRFAVGEIERLVRVIDELANNARVRREGEFLVARALGRLRERPAGKVPSSISAAARLHGAVARYEFVLRQAGFLDDSELESFALTNSPT